MFLATSSADFCPAKKPSASSFMMELSVLLVLPETVTVEFMTSWMLRA